MLYDNDCNECGSPISQFRDFCIGCMEERMSARDRCAVCQVVFDDLDGEMCDACTERLAGDCGEEPPYYGDSFDTDSWAEAAVEDSDISVDENELQQREPERPECGDCGEPLTAHEAGMQYDICSECYTEKLKRGEFDYPPPDNRETMEHSSYSTDDDYYEKDELLTVDEVADNLGIDLDERVAVRSPDIVIDDVRETFARKNDDYGNSWRKVSAIKRVLADPEGPRIVRLDSGEEAVVLAPTPRIETQAEQEFDDVLSRLLDKVCRAYNLVRLGDGDAENEPAIDAGEDIVGYGAMITTAIERFVRGDGE